MLQPKSLAPNRSPHLSKPFSQKQPYFKSKNQKYSHKNPQLSSNNQNSPNSKQPTHNCLPIKDYKLKLNKNDSFSSSKILKRKSSIFSNIYRPKLNTKEQSEVHNYLEIKNMNLIKENIKKLEINIPHGIPSLLKNPNWHKFRLNGLFKNQSKTQRTPKQPSHRQPVFVFPNEPNQEMFTKRRKLSQHFERSKYFNCESFLKKDLSIRRQKTEYRINTSLTKEKVAKEKIKQSRSLIEDVIPIIKRRTNKPKTAGGFLKKYSVQEFCLRPDFQLHLTQEDIF